MTVLGFMKKNWILILLVVVVIVAVILIATRKRKSEKYSEYEWSGEGGCSTCANGGSSMYYERDNEMEDFSDDEPETFADEPEYFSDDDSLNDDEETPLDDGAMQASAGEDMEDMDNVEDMEDMEDMENDTYAGTYKQSLQYLDANHGLKTLERPLKEVGLSLQTEVQAIEAGDFETDMELHAAI